MAVHNITNYAGLTGLSLNSGDMVIFAPGTYNFTSTYSLVAGVQYYGSPGNNSAGNAGGTTITNASGVDPFHITNPGQNNIIIAGFTFDGATAPQNSQIFIAGQTGSTTSGGVNISITDCVFQNLTASCPNILFYQCDGLRIEDNLFTNSYQGVSGHNNDTMLHSNIAIRRNTLSGIARYAIEVQSNYSYTGLDVSFNTISISGQGVNGGISVVGNARAQTAGSVIGNRIKNVFCGIEIGDTNFTVAGNILTNIKGTGSGVLVSSCAGSRFYLNVLRNVDVPFGQDGGFVNNQWIGWNNIAGADVFGASGQSWSNVGSGPTNARSLASLAAYGDFSGGVGAEVSHAAMQDFLATLGTLVDASPLF